MVLQQRSITECATVPHLPLKPFPPYDSDLSLYFQARHESMNLQAISIIQFARYTDLLQQQ